jgi:hypothetical protein
MDSAYRNGITDANREEITDSLLMVLLVNRRNDILARGITPGTADYDAYVASVRGEIIANLSNDHFVLGIEGVNAQTNREVAQLDGRRAAVGPRYQAEAEEIIEAIVQDGQRRVNELLAQPGGRALVALEAALEVAHRPPERVADLREPRGPKDQHHDEHDDEDLVEAEPHVRGR